VEAAKLDVVHQLISSSTTKHHACHAKATSYQASRLAKFFTKYIQNIFKFLQNIFKFLQNIFKI
jgi:hypothetical protein